MDLLTNPWVIIAIVLSVIVGNIMALKYTAKMKFGQTSKKDNKDHSAQDDQDQTDDHSPS
ncbi:hypothetical protein VISI1226_02922 [Vibrio sinaloensis DSM 21326]|uniref:DUF2897 domain-containing protein n=1 Tax=Vibrio sinaloensis DSM 21326 TaxID=945550 RepID=E8M9J5_PHOS4|nr:DUF2897 family protein [Vibrio sinaloensis]EGA69362.1 hypothetical protein VISI1226_02922 [Vibrio sinaloensis DSM 21326]